MSQKCISCSSFPLSHLWCQIMSLVETNLYPWPAFLLLNGEYHRASYNERLDVLIKLPSHLIMCPGLRSEKWLQRRSYNLYLLDETKLRVQGHQITSNCKPQKRAKQKITSRTGCRKCFAISFTRMWVIFPVSQSITCHAKPRVLPLVTVQNSVPVGVKTV